MLSKQLGSTVLLKREDLQVGGASSQAGREVSRLLPAQLVVKLSGRGSTDSEGPGSHARGLVELRAGSFPEGLGGKGLLKRPTTCAEVGTVLRPGPACFGLPWVALASRLQPVRSFKVRGAYNRMSRLTQEQVSSSWVLR